MESETTIRLNPRTKSDLDGFRQHKGESYDEANLIYTIQPINEYLQIIFDAKIFNKIILV